MRILKVVKTKNFLMRKFCSSTMIAVPLKVFFLTALLVSIQGLFVYSLAQCLQSTNHSNVDEITCFLNKLFSAFFF